MTNIARPILLAAISVGLCGCPFKPNDQFKETLYGAVVTPGEPSRVVGQTFSFEAFRFLQTPDIAGGPPKQTVLNVTEPALWYSSNPEIATIKESSISRFNLGGLATAKSPGATKISIIYQGILYKDVATFHVTAAGTAGRDLLYVSDSSLGKISVFDAAAVGDVAPLRTIAGPTTTLKAPDQMVMHDDWLIVADRVAGAVLFFDRNAREDAAPLHAIRNLTAPQGIAVVKNFAGVPELYVSSASSTGVLRFKLPPDGSPSGSPLAPLGATGHLARALDPARPGTEEVLVVLPAISELDAYTSGAGNPGVFSTIPGFDLPFQSSQRPLGLASDGRFHYVSTSAQFGAGNLGTVVVVPAAVPAPIRLSPHDGAGRAPYVVTSLDGSDSADPLLDPRGLTVSSEHLFVACSGNDLLMKQASIAAFKLSALLGTTPTKAERRIIGPKTGLSKPSGVLFVPDTTVSVVMHSLTVTPGNPLLLVGEKQNFTATANFSNGTSEDVTLNATWTSTNPGVATVGGDGSSVAVSLGTTDIVAAWHGRSHQVSLIVSDGSDMAGSQADLTAVADLGAPSDLTATTGDLGGSPDLGATADDQGAPSDMGATGDLSGAGDLTTTTVADLSMTGSVDLGPPVHRLFVATPNSGAPGSIRVFPIGAQNMDDPIRTIAGPSTLLLDPGQAVAVGSELFVLDRLGVHVFDINTSGDSAPKRSISWTSTTINSPAGITVVGSEIYVSYKHGFAVFPIGGSGNMAPSRTITTINFMPSGSLSLMNSYIPCLTTTMTPGEILFPPGSNGGSSDRLLSFSTTAGNPPPALRDFRPIANAPLYYVTSDGAGKLFALSNAANGLLIMNDDVTGTGLQTIQGTNTGLGAFGGVHVFNGEIFVAFSGSQKVLVFDATLPGNVAPKRTLTLKPVLNGTIMEPANPTYALVALAQ